MTVYRFDEIAINSKEKKKPVDEDKNYYIGLEHLDSGTLEVTRWGAESAPKGDKLIMKKGDVLLGKRRAYQKKVGIAPFDGIFSAHGMVLRPVADVIDPTFFPFFISSDCFLDEVIRVSVGSLSPTANWKDLQKLEFDIPSLEKQCELASVLKQSSILKSWYAKLLQTADDLVKSQFVEMFGDPTGDSALFNLRQVGSFSSVSSGATPKRDKPEYYGGEIPWVKTTEVAAGNVAETEETISKLGLVNSSCHIVPAGSILVAMYGQGGTRGRASMLEIDAATNQACAAIEPDKTVDSLFLLSQLRLCYEDLRAKSKGGNQKNLSLQTLKAYTVIVPPIELQRIYSDFVHQVDKSKFHHDK